MSTSIITQAIEWLLDKLKAKNGFVYSIILAVLALIYFSLQYIVGHPELGIVIPDSLHDTVNTALAVLAVLMGSHTTAAQKASDLKQTINPEKQ